MLFLKLAECIDAKKDFRRIRNLWIKEQEEVFRNEVRPLVDVNELPMCDRALYFDKYPQLRNAPTKKFLVIWGCPYSCTYCFNHALRKLYEGKGAYVRCMDVEKIIGEINSVKQAYGMRWVNFNSDMINISRDWFMHFLDEYSKRVDVPFLCNVRIDRIDEEMVNKMKAAGCERVVYGIESGDEKMRKNILKRDISDKQIIEHGTLFNTYKIRVQTTNLIGLPHETEDTVMKAVRLNRIVKPEIAQRFILQPYPRTEIHEYSIQAGLLEPAYGFSRLGCGFQVDFEALPDMIPLGPKPQRRLLNLFYFFDLLVRYKWLEPLIRLLLYLPPNRFFRFIYVFPLIRQDIRFDDSFRNRSGNIIRLLRILAGKNFHFG